MDWISLSEAAIKSVILPSLVSGIITYYFNQRREERWNKLKTFQQLLANRHDLKGEPFTQALNQLFVVFYSSEKVIKALKEFHEVIYSSEQKPDGPFVEKQKLESSIGILNKENNLKNATFVKLMNALCNDLGVSTKLVGDKFFLIPFNTKPTSQTRASQ